MTEKKQVGSVEPVPQNTPLDTNQNQARMLGERIHSPSSAWSYHSHWDGDFPSPGQNPPTPPSTYPALVALQNLALSTPAPTPFSQSSNLPSKKYRPQFGPSLATSNG